MIPLPPGCSRAYEITFNVTKLTDEMGQWFIDQGGRAWAEEEYDWRGRRKLRTFVQYGRAKPSHHSKNSDENVLIRFAGEDASTASVFLIKFFNEITQHNMQDYLNYD